MKNRKSIKNYTTTIKVEITIMEIEKILSQFGATNIFKLYENGIVKGIAFQSTINEQSLAFKLPMEEDKVLQVFNLCSKKGDIPKKFSGDREQARRTGWRIIKDWIDSQMSLIAINTVKFEQVFLPYMYDMKTNQTLFEKFEQRNFNLEIEDKTNVGMIEIKEEKWVLF